MTARKAWQELLPATRIRRAMEAFGVSAPDNTFLTCYSICAAADDHDFEKMLAMIEAEYGDGIAVKSEPVARRGAGLQVLIVFKGEPDAEHLSTQ